MNGKQYWKDKIPLFHHQYHVCMVLLSVFLFFVGNNVDSIAVILIIWTMFTGWYTDVYLSSAKKEIK